MLAVLIYHLLPPATTFRLSGGYLGVDIFFVLSGFLITTLLLDEHRQTGSIDLRRFFVRRALRLLPALLLLLAAAALAALSADLDIYEPDQIIYERVVIAGDYNLLSRWLSIVATLFPVSNGVIATSHHTGPLSVAWSLAIEDQFYMLWPLILLFLLSRLHQRKRILLYVAVGIVVSASLRVALLLQGASLHHLFAATYTRADALLMGCALGLAASDGLLPVASRARRTLTAGGFVSGAWILWLFATDDGTGERFHYAGGYTAVAGATALFLAYLLIAPNSVLARALGTPVLTLLGRVSYGVYLWHAFILWHFRLVFGRGVTGLVLALLATALIAAVSYRFVELPCLRLKDRFQPPLHGQRRPPDGPGRHASVMPLGRGMAIGTLIVLTIAALPGLWLWTSGSAAYVYTPPQGGRNVPLARSDETSNDEVRDPTREARRMKRLDRQVRARADAKSEVATPSPTLAATASSSPQPRPEVGARSDTDARRDRTARAGDRVRPERVRESSGTPSAPPS